MRILLVRIFFLLCFFTLPELPPTGTYLRWYLKERKEKKNRCLGLIFPFFF